MKGGTPVSTFDVIMSVEVGIIALYCLVMLLKAMR
jgi:hypothetical protein